MADPTPLIRSHLRIRMAEQNIRTVKELANRVGVKNPGTLQKMANGTCRHYPDYLLSRLCIVLNCQIGDLISVVK